MTQSDWIKAKDPAAMLAQVRQFLGRRRWELYLVKLARRVEKLVPLGSIRNSIDQFEQSAGQPRNPHVPDNMIEACEREMPRCLEYAEQRVRDIVRSADPDAQQDEFTHGQPRKTNPSAPLFQAASEAAQEAISSARQAADGVFPVMLSLLTESHGTYDRGIRLYDRIHSCLQWEAQSSASAASALKLKQLGDDWADRENGRSVGQRYSAALEMVRREQEHRERLDGNSSVQVTKSLNRTVGQILHEMVGNPFAPLPSMEHCRSDDVMGLANTIDECKRYDLMPILADALLEADCEDENVLRHCRGNAEPLHRGVHGPGCWVIDLILNRDVDFFAKVQVKKSSRKQLRSE